MPYIRRIFPRVLQDDRGSAWMPCEHGGRVIDLPIDDDPTALRRVMLLDFVVRDVLGGGFARHRNLLAGGVQVHGFG